MLDDRSKQRRRNGEVMRRMLSPAEFFAKRVKGCAASVITIDVVQQATQLFKGCSIESAVFFQAVLGPGAKLVEVPARFRDPDDGYLEMPAFDHRLQRGKDFLVGQVAGCSEKDQRVRMDSIIHVDLL